MAQIKSFLLIAFIGVTFSGFAQTVEAFLTNSVFYAPDMGPYVETDILIMGPTIAYNPVETNKFQGMVEVSLLFKKGDTIVAFEKYNLKSSEIDSNAIALNLLDKKRFALPNGVYFMEATFRDVNSDDPPYIYTENVIVDIEIDKVQLSNISLIDHYEKKTTTDLYTKSGYHMAPYVINYYPETIDALTFYAEVYHTDLPASNKFLAVYSIKKLKENSVIGNLSAYQKLESRSVNPILASFDIADLPTGNYNLVIEIKDKENTLVALKKLFFQRSKPREPVPLNELDNLIVEGSFVEAFDKDALLFQIHSTLPIAHVRESKIIKEYIKYEIPLKELQSFLLNFWISRSPDNPRKAWEAYAKEVQKAEDHYSTNNQHGFETDRGRIYLQYGPPNDITGSPREPGAYPYEIWKYYSLYTGQSNVKFVFYDMELGTNNYLLLHSTARGEIRNDNWQREIQKTFTGGNDPLRDGLPVRDHYGSRSKDNYKE